MGREKMAERMARVHLSRQMKKEKKERREVVLQVIIIIIIIIVIIIIIMVTLTGLPRFSSMKERAEEV